MAKIVVFSNLKGGTGKSTLCCHFAHALTAAGQQVAVIDADTSQNIYNMRQRELVQMPDAATPWPVYPMSKNDANAIVQKIQQLDGIVLIDCPGSLSEPHLRPFFAAADVAVIPFRWDDFMIDSTITFTKVLRQVSKASLYYVPNIIKLNVKYPLEETTTAMFNKVGKVTFRVKDGVAIQRLSTVLPQDEYQRLATAGAFAPIIEKLIPVQK